MILYSVQAMYSIGQTITKKFMKMGQHPTLKSLVHVLNMFSLVGRSELEFVI